MNNRLNQKENVNDLIKCCLSSKREHIIREPRLLECGGNCCLTCVQELIDIDEIKCKYCMKIHTNVSLKNNFTNPLVNKLINMFSSELIDEMRVKCNEFVEELSEVNIDSLICTRLSLIENEVDVKIESLKNELDLVKDELKKKLNKLKNGLKRVNPSGLIAETKRKLSDTKDLFDLQHKLDILMQLNCNLQNCLNAISFKVNDTKTNLSTFVGTLVYPSYFDLVEYECINLIPHDGIGVETCCLLDDKILINSCDPQLGSIIFYSVENRHPPRKEHLNSYLMSPSCVCSTKDDLIIIGESSREEILFYESKSLKLVNKFQSKPFASIYYLAYDNEFGNVYASYAGSNEVVCYNKCGQVVGQAQVDSPVYMRVFGNKVYVLNDKNYDYSKDDKEKFIQNAYVTSGIYVMDKKMLKIIDKIQFSTWIAPSGLWIDDSGWIYTLTSEFKDKKRSAKQTVLYVINSNGHLVNKLLFDINEYPRDIVIYNKKLYILLKEHFAEISSV